MSRGDCQVIISGGGGACFEPGVHYTMLICMLLDCMLLDLWCCMVWGFLFCLWIGREGMERDVCTRCFDGIVCWVRFVMGCILLHFNGLIDMHIHASEDVLQIIHLNF